MSIYSGTQKQIALRLSSENKDLASKWSDWSWQLKHSVTCIDTFERLLDIEFDAQERSKIELTLKKYPLSITPYYLSLIERSNYPRDPIFRQVFPDPQELQAESSGLANPLADDQHSPARGIRQRGAKRVEFQISNVCGSNCRHCPSKRKAGEIDSIPDQNQLRVGLDYLHAAVDVREVLLSGGDPLMLNDAYLDWLLSKLRQIGHLEQIQIISRLPVVLPYRITDELTEMLAKHQPLSLETQFNHPQELTGTARRTLKKLADAGISLSNETILLAGVNDSATTLNSLFQQLEQIRVRPEKLCQCDLTEGISHFATPIGRGIGIFKGVFGQSGASDIPDFVMNTPAGQMALTPEHLTDRRIPQVPPAISRKRFSSLPERLRAAKKQALAGDSG